MKKIVLLIILLIPLNVKAFDNIKLYSDKVIVYDMTDDLMVYEKNTQEKVSIASLTKMLTVMTALNNINNLEEEITITSDMLSNIYWDASVAGLSVGDTITYLDLIYATLLPSGADAAQVLALNIAPTSEDFVSKMNELALQIGMVDSHFLNTSGLDSSGQYSTAKDVLVLLKYALQNAYFKKAFMTREYTLSNGLDVTTTLYTYNKKINQDISRILGSKSGRTGEAGLCLASLIEFKNHEFLIITLGAPLDNSYNLLDTLTIINYLDNNYVIPFPIEVVNKNVLMEIWPLFKEDEVSYNYRFIIFSLGVLISFPILVIPSKKGKRRKKGF